MPAVVNPATGQLVYVPGVYTVVETLGSLPGPPPVYHVPVVVADVDEGVPHTYDEDREDNEPELGGFRLVTGSAQAATWARRGSDAELFLRHAFRAGLPFAYLVTAQALERASVVATSTGPVTEWKLYAEKWGAPGGWIKIGTPAPSQISVQPPRRWSRVNADVASGATRLYVRDNQWVREGMTIEIGDNNGANVERVVADTGRDLGPDGRPRWWVDVTVALAGSISVAAGAAIAEYADQDVVTSPALAGDAMIDWINRNAPGVRAVRAATFTGSAHINVSATAPIKDLAGWGTVAAGLAPPSSPSDHADLIAWLNAEGLDAFKLQWGQVARTWGVASGVSTVHGAWRDFATSLRSNGEPISVNVGTRYGDVALGAGDDTDPIHRAAALDSQDVQLAAGSVDGFHPYLSLSAIYFGRRVSGGVGHNLTQDPFTYESLYPKWDERGAGELTALHRAGVATYRLRGSRPYRFVLSQGLSTLQTNLLAWNSDNHTTPLVMQRDLADAVDADLTDALDGSQLGREVTAASIAATVLSRGRGLRRRGWIRDDDDALRLVSIEEDGSGAGFNAEWAVRLPVTVDYITGRTLVRLEE